MSLKNAKWICAPVDTGSAAVSFVREFDIKKPVAKAIIHASAIGVYTLKVNDVNPDKWVLAPGWTSYRHRVQYQEYDVTSLLGANARIELTVAPGWAVGDIGWVGDDKYFAENTSVILSLDITYTDGKTEQIVTDKSWQTLTTAVTYAQIYHGETIDCTAPIHRLGFAAVDKEVTAELIPTVGEKICEQEKLAPIELIRTPAGETVIDFGQNMTGYVEVKIRAPRGSRISIQHAEVLDRNGNFYRANYRAARSENTFICSGGQDTFKPQFSFQGFRYIKLAEYPLEQVDLSCFRAIAVNSDMRRTGTFRCGNELINQLYHNIIWGQKSNYLDIPTDCPQRDERLGWTGDAQVFFRTAAINFDVKKFFIKWLGDMALEQHKDGAVEGVVPACLRTHKTNISTAWGDAACVIPFEMYTAYGDKELLGQHFPMMQKWVEYMHAAGPEEFLWLGGGHYGDWLAMDGNPDECVGQTPTDFLASAGFAYCTLLLIRAGYILGKDVKKYEQMYAKIKEAFRARYMKDGLPLLLRNGSDSEIQIDETETAYVILLRFALCNDDEREGITEALVKLIEKKGGHMTTGFVGTPHILQALSENGRVDVAYDLLLKETSPSWLYSVLHGATTMWEHWNGIREDGTFWSEGMNSFNHYAFGAVYDWIFTTVLGINTAPAAPAYEKIAIEPHPDRRLGFAEATYETKFGSLRSYWYYKGERIYYEFDIPEGITAYLSLPSGYNEILTGGKYCFTE